MVVNGLTKIMEVTNMKSKILIGLFVLLGFVSFGNEVSAECGGVSCASSL